MKLLRIILCLLLSYSGLSGQITYPVKGFNGKALSRHQLQLPVSHSVQREQVSFYIDYPTASEFEKGIGDGIIYPWAFNSLYRMPDDSDLFYNFNKAGILFNALAGYSDGGSIIETYNVFPYPNDLEVTIDSIFIYLVHENQSGEPNKLFIDIVPVEEADSNGNFTRPAVWTDSLITSTSISPNGWLGEDNIRMLQFPVNKTIEEKMAIMVRYYAPKSDTLGLLAEYIPSTETSSLPHAQQQALVSSYPTALFGWPKIFGNEKLTNASRTYYVNANPIIDTFYFFVQNWEIIIKATFEDVTKTKAPETVLFKNGGILPNPSADGPIRVKFGVQERANLQFSIYTITGQKVFEKSTGWLEPGEHELMIDQGKLASGTYFCRFEGTHHSGSSQLLIINN